MLQAKYKGLTEGFTKACICLPSIKKRVLFVVIIHKVD